MNICIIGSCRIEKPLQKHGHKSICGLNKQFVHNSVEIIQRINFLKGNLFPDNLINYIFRVSIDQSKFKPVDFDKIDLFIIEVSTLKNIKYNEYSLQDNKLSEEIEKNTKFENNKELINFLEKSNNVTKNDIDSTEEFFDIAKNIKLSYQTYELLKKDIIEILNLLGKPVLFVNHINVKVNGEYIERRNLLSKYMNQLSTELKFDIFNPNEIIEKYGENKMLDDVNHYSEYGEDIIGEYLLNKAKKIV